jgi:general secretion pathway protein K
MKTRSRGVALITALLVVAIATIAATAVLSATGAELHRTATLRDTEQASWYAQGVESWVLGLLKKDEQDNDYDGQDEYWNTCVVFPVDDGTITGHVVDEQRLFNLNNLAAPPGGVDYVAQFTRLLQEFDIPSDFAGAVKDWIDADDLPGFPAGAEDMTYLGLTPPYRTGNRFITSVSELLAIQGMTPELYRKLAPFVTALPQSGTPVNVNTAPQEVLLALSASVDLGKLKTFIDERVETPLENIQQFHETGILGADANQAVDIRTQYFRIEGDIFVGSSHVALYSSIYRPPTGAPPVVLTRSTVPDLAGTKPCVTPST